MTAFRVLQIDHVELFVYFCDPDGHLLEVTTYDHDEASELVASLRKP